MWYAWKIRTDIQGVVEKANTDPQEYIRRGPEACWRASCIYCVHEQSFSTHFPIQVAHLSPERADLLHGTEDRWSEEVTC